MKAIVISIISVFLILITFILREFVGVEWTGYLIGLASLLLSIINKLIDENLDGVKNVFLKIILLKRIPVKIRSITNLFIHFDLSLVLVSLVYFITAFNESFNNAITDLRDKGFLLFPEGKNGLVHLQRYVAGYLGLLAYLMTLGLYGLYHGVNRKKLLFSRLLISVFLGMILVITILSIIRGGWSGQEYLDRYMKENEVELPDGTRYVFPFFIFVVFIIFCLTWSFYVWLLYHTGRSMRKLLQNLKSIIAKSNHVPSINNAPKNLLVQKLKISEKMADLIINTREKHGKLTFERFLAIKGIGPKRAERAKDNFSFD